MRDNHIVSPCGLLLAGGEYGWAQCSRTTSVAAESDFRFQVQNAASILDLATYRLEDLPIANQIIPQVLPVSETHCKHISFPLSQIGVRTFKFWTETFIICAAPQRMRPPRRRLISCTRSCSRSSCICSKCRCGP